MTDKVYDFLTAPKRTASKIKAKRWLRAEKLSGMMPGAIRYDVPRVQSSPADRMIQASAEVDMIDREIEQLKNDLREQRREIADTAGSLECKDGMEVIIRRYIDGLQWKDVARAMHKSQSTVFRIHREAVDELDHILPESDSCPHENV